MKVASLFVLIVLIVVNAYGQNEQDFEIQTNDTGITILRYKGTKKDVQIPSKILGTPVTMIYNRAFYMKQLSSVSIPESVFYIGPEAFKNNRLTEVTIPDSVTSLGNGAFASNLLTKVDMPPKIEYIASSAFFNNKLEDIKIPDSVVVIGGMAFANNKIVNIQIPGKVIYIGGKAFESNPIKQILLSESVKYIGNGAFNFSTTTTGITNLTVEIGDYVEISTETDAGSYSRSFPFYFEKYYDDKGRQKGRYTYNNSGWSFNE